jgi:hypothetical protein
MKSLKTLLLAGIAVASSVAPFNLAAQLNVGIPDIPGYQTLKCDLHIHSVFSDGDVWPTVRVTEAAREGLDAISLTEHLEYRPHHSSGDMVSTHDRSYDIALPLAEQRDVILIRGSEITRPMAPGHANALFLEDSDPLATKEWRDSYAAAKKQNAFIFWNHPGWQSQQRDETLWWPEHTELLEGGMMHGIEVANGRSYSPEAHQWCIDKGLTMLGTTDVHAPIQAAYAPDRHRTMTLVFAAERSAAAIREALDARRTIVYVDELLIGDVALLKSLFESSVEITDVDTSDARRIMVSWRNDSDLTFRLRKTDHEATIDYMPTGELTIAPRARGSFLVRFPEGTHGNINFEVVNMLVAPGQGLPLSYEF